MYMKHFWTEKERIPEGYGYGQFSAKHFVLIFLCLLLTIAVSAMYKGADPHIRLVILRTIGITLMVIEIIKLIVIGFSDISVLEYLPLELCSFAGYSIFCDSIRPFNTFFPILLLTLFLPAAIMAIFFPTTSSLPVFNFHTIHQFLFHGLIVAYVMARFFSGEIPMSYALVWPSIFKALILVGIIYVIDIVFDKNFMFLRDTYNNPVFEMIEKATGSGFPYVIGLGCFSIVMIHIFFFIFKIVEILFIK